jgi:hypothetical protein
MSSSGEADASLYVARSRVSGCSWTGLSPFAVCYLTYSKAPEARIQPLADRELFASTLADEAYGWQEKKVLKEKSSRCTVTTCRGGCILL